MTKTLIIMLIGIIGALSQTNEIWSQTVVSYKYDAAGNRIERTIVLPTAKANSVSTDSTGQTKEMIFEEQIGEQKVLIYPNPTKGQLLVEIIGYEKETSSGIYLYNLSGTKLFSKSPVTGHDPIDMSALPAGSYVLKFFIGNKSYTWKIIKE